MSVPIAKYELPLPPSINQSYQPVTIRGKTSLISKVVHKQFKRDARLLLANQTQLLNSREREAFVHIIKTIKLNDWFIALDVLFFLENILSRDEDGGLKVVQDVVCKHIGIDDKYVIDAHIGKRLAHGNQRCEVAVYLFQEAIA